MNLKTISLLIIVLILNGCAISQKQDFTQVKASLSVTSKGMLAVGVQDQRPYILDHEKGEDYVGTLRGGFGNPWNMGTESHLPLAEDMSTVLVNALTSTHVKTLPLKLSPSLSKTQVIQAFKDSNADKLLLLSLYHWKSDTMMDTALQYDIEMSVINRQGKTLATQKAQGTDRFGKDIWNPVGHVQKAVPAAFQQKIETLFSGDIAKALSQ